DVSSTFNKGIVVNDFSMILSHIKNSCSGESIVKFLQGTTARRAFSSHILLIKISMGKITGVGIVVFWCLSNIDRG
ncbi:MAG: hypothetical protein ACJZ77_05570, partial [Pseudohongiellaceae bacterium]